MSCYGAGGVVAIGVGGMVGGGIFAVLGLAVQMAHGGTPVAFALAVNDFALGNIVCHCVV